MKIFKKYLSIALVTALAASFTPVLSAQDGENKIAMQEEAEPVLSAQNVKIQIAPQMDSASAQADLVERDNNVLKKKVVKLSLLEKTILAVVFLYVGSLKDAAVMDLKKEEMRVREHNDRQKASGADSTEDSLFLLESCESLEKHRAVVRLRLMQVAALATLVEEFTGK